jgi:dTDP-4-dehydrorhamnose reductase
MKILFFGNRGWIGSQFISYLKTKEDIDIVITNVCADNEDLIKDVILLHSPTHIVSFIGRTHGEGINSSDYLEQEGKLVENVRDNLYAPLVLSLLAERNNIHFTYIGTGCIFDEDDPSIRTYYETDKPNFFGSSYSIVKGFTDRLMKFNKNTLNLRIRMPINSEIHNRNFITKIVKYEKICSKSNSMTVLPTIYPIIYDMMINKHVGTYNLTNPNYITHNEILEMYKEIVDENFKWENFTIEEQNKILKSKRSNNHLNTTKIEKVYPEFPDIKTAIRDCLVEMKKNLNKIEDGR